MELRVTSKNTEISETEHQYLQKKLAKLVRHLPNITESIVEITKEKTKEPQGRYVVQVTLNCGGTLLRGEVRAPALAAAIDNITDVLDRRIERLKGRRYEKGRKVEEHYDEGIAVDKAMVEDAVRLVRTKRFSVKPMSVDEAIEQMELLGHDFFLFVNTNNNQSNVVYRRRDGGYGLIETEVG